MKQKIFTLLLAMMANVGTVFAYGIKIGDLNYFLNFGEKTAEVTAEAWNNTTNYSYLTSINIPSTITYNGDIYRVTGIFWSAFANCEGLNSITIPNSVTSIGDGAFSNCSELTSPVYNAHVFASMPESYSGDYVIPDGITSITGYAFRNCSGLTSITIPNSVISIGNDAFQGCSGLPIIDNIRYADTYLVEAVDKTLITYNIKEGTRFIGSSAFSDCISLASISIPESVISIRSSAFYGCNNLPVVDNIRYADTYLIEAVDKTLSTYNIQEGTRFVGSSAFYDCSSLTSIDIPNSVTSIESGAFSGCNSLTSIKIESGNKKYDSRNNCNAIIETATNTLIVGCQNTIIPNSVTSIGDNAFYGCSSLTSITIPNSVTNIGDDAFYGCSGLTSITIPNSVKSIGMSSFSGCSGLTSPVYNAHIFAYMPQSYSGEYIIPEGIESIAYGAFWGCSGLTSVSIPGCVKSIGDEAFKDCNGLISVTISDGVTSIGYDAFGQCSNLTSITIPGSVKSLEERAFWGCNRLTSVTIEEGVTCIGLDAFYGCSGLTSVKIPNSVMRIRSGAFSSCNGLPVIDNIRYADTYLVEAVDKTLITYNIKEGTRFIGSSAFWNCSSLTSINIPESVISIGVSAFSKCSSLTSIEIPESVTSIDLWAFTGCSGLKSITCKAITPPTLACDAFNMVDKSIPLYVPAESISAYQAAYGWKDFTNILPIPEAEPEKTDITVTYNDKDAAELDNEQIILHLPEVPVVPGFTFVGWDVVAGHLTDGITIQAIYTYNGDPTSAPSVVSVPNNKAQKLIRNGNLYILSEEKTYTVQGQEVR